MTIEITVSPTGQTRVETKGFTGPACRVASQYVEAALGKRMGEHLTGEFYQTETTDHTIEEKQA